MAQPGVTAKFRGGEIDAPRGISESIDIDRTGRYVRIQLSVPGRISLAEVELFAPDVDPQPLRTFTVNSTGDLPDAAPGDSVCLTGAGFCTLRAALQEASLDGGPTNVEFNIAGLQDHTIVLSSELPPLWDAYGGTSIDGYSQPGSSPNTLTLGGDAEVRIGISSVSMSQRGLEILGPGNSVRGLAIENLSTYGIRIHGKPATDNIIQGNWFGLSAGAAQRPIAGPALSIIDGGSRTLVGGPTPADRNVLVRSERGIDIRGSRSRETTIENNYFGISPDGLSPIGVANHCIDVNTGGTGTIIRSNVIASCEINGIELSHTEANRDHLIEDNIIGADPFLQFADSSWGNGDFGILMEDRVNQTTVRNNVIVFNQAGGIRTFKNVSQIVIENNWIGVLPSSTPAPNAGFGVGLREGSVEIQVGPNNVIAHNDTDGVRVSGGEAGEVFTDRVTITQNSMFENGDLGIDILSGAPDPLPSLVLATPNRIDGSACAGCLVELFRAAPDPAGAGEGSLYLGNVVAAGDGSFSFTPAGGQLSVGQFVTGTATENASTSRFATNIEVVPVGTNVSA